MVTSTKTKQNCPTHPILTTSFSAIAVKRYRNAVQMRQFCTVGNATMTCVSIANLLLENDFLFSVLSFLEYFGRNGN